MNNNCQNNSTMSPDMVLLLNRIPVLRFLKDPAKTLDDLYIDYPDGLSYGSFALVSPIEGTSYFAEWKVTTETWEPITGDLSSILSQVAPIMDTDFFSESLIFSSNTGNAIKINNIWTNILSSATGKNVNYIEVTSWFDGSPMNDSKVDGIIYRKRGDVYLRMAVNLNELDVSLWGAVGDGVTDDTTAIQQAVIFSGNTGISIRMMEKHKITSSINISGNVKIQGKNTLFIFPDLLKSIYAFESSASNIDITGININNISGMVHQLTSFDTMVINNCHYDGVPNVITNYFINIVSILTANKVVITNNNLQKCTIFFTDRFRCNDLIIDDNEVIDGTRFLVRALPEHGSSPIGAESPKRVSFCRNSVNGVNTGLTDKSNVARVLQISAIEKITMNDNYIYHLNTTNAGTVLYWSFGSLDFFRNTIKRIEGTEGGVHDKSGVESNTYGYKFNSGNNVFDQSEVTNYTVETIFKFYALSNFTTSGDKFIGCRCPIYRIYQSVDINITPENFTFKNVEVYDHKYPVVVQMIQQCKNVIVDGIKVNKISNPDNMVVNGESRLRLVDLYMTFNNGLGIENIIIQNNEVIESSSNFVFELAYKNAVSVTGYIKNIFTKDNTTLQSEALCRFINGQDLGYFLFANNNSNTPVIGIGTTPPNMALLNNLPRPSLNYSLTGSTLAAGATRRILQALPNTSLGDFVKASLSLGVANLSIVGNVPTTNNVEVFLTNTSTSSITIPDCTLYINVEKR